MKNANEVWFSNYSQKKSSLHDSVNTAVSEFTDLWATQVGVRRTFTVEEFNDKFIDYSIAVSVFKSLGFKVTYTCGKTTGHLWWKKTCPDKIEIEAPNPNVSK